MNWTEMAESSAPIFEKLRTRMRGRLRTDEPMADHTTWRIGGPADLLIEPADIDDLRFCVELLRDGGIPWLPLGSGSNLLVRDGGIRGAVIGMRYFRDIRFEPGNSVVTGAGLPLMSLIRATTEEGLTGLEQLSGIPGTVGGAVFMNAGAGDRDMAGVVQSVQVLAGSGEKNLCRDELGFEYRRSRLSQNEIVFSVRLKLDRGEPEELQRIVKETLRNRRRTQGVGAPSAGSVFKNPPGQSAWKLIEKAGLRGRQVGGAKVSERHANFIINAGQATASDILELIDLVRDEVVAVSGVLLEPEVRILGTDSPEMPGVVEMEKR
ncbi:MAG: UDP-N-acetylmuramate dehydrogenase [Desulfuromonadales bacterium]